MSWKHLELYNVAIAKIIQIFGTYANSSRKKTRKPSIERY